MSRYAVCVDFDGTIAKKSKWSNNGIDSEPNDGAREAMEKLMEDYVVVIWTSRLSDYNNKETGSYVKNSDMLLHWLTKWGFLRGKHFVSLSGDKVPAKFYIDDHAVRFDSWDNVTKLIDNIKEFEDGRK